MPTFLIIAVRELLVHIRKPSFYLATIGLPLLIGALMFLSAAMDESDEPAADAGIGAQIAEQELKPFGYVDHSGTIAAVPEGFPAGFVRAFASEAEGRAALEREELGQLYVLPADYQASGNVTWYQADSPLGEPATRELFELLVLANLVPEGQQAAALRLAQPMQLTSVSISTAGGADSDEQGQAGSVALGLAFTLILALSIFTSSGMLLQAVVEEKEGRTIEVLLSTITPRELLVGKILGLGMLGMLQLLIWLAAGGALLGTDSPLLAALGAVEVPATIWALTLLYFVLGYALFAALMASVGAVSPSVKESSQISAVITLPAMLPLFLLGPLTSDPDGAATLALSIFPLTSPATMILRIATTPVPAWQIGLSLGLLVAASAGTIWAAGRLFRARALLDGQRLALREVGRAMMGR